jgi:hypothetical protein
MKSLSIALVVPILSLLAGTSAAQCTPLGTPGQTGCGLSATTANTLICTDVPTIGNANFAINTIVQCNPGPPLLLIGPCLPAPIAVPGPYGTNGFCGPSAAGCFAYVGPSIFLALPGTPSALGFWFALPIPNDPSLIGGTVCVQEVNFCILFVGQCLAVSNGMSITVQ